MNFRGAQRPRSLDKVILKSRYNILLGHSIFYVQVELVEALKNAICVVPENYKFLDTELKVYRGTSNKEIS